MLAVGRFDRTSLLPLRLGARELAVLSSAVGPVVGVPRLVLRHVPAGGLLINIALFLEEMPPGYASLLGEFHLTFLAAIRRDLVGSVSHVLGAEEKETICGWLDPVAVLALTLGRASPRASL